MFPLVVFVVHLGCVGSRGGVRSVGWQGGLHRGWLAGDRPEDDQGRHEGVCVHHNRHTEEKMEQQEQEQAVRQETGAGS